MKILWTKTAFGHLENARQYISSANPHALKLIRDALRSAQDNLLRFPDSGMPGRVKGTRELLIPGQRLFLVYQVNSPNIEILALIHTSQKWP